MIEKKICEPVKNLNVGLLYKLEKSYTEIREFLDNSRGLWELEISTLDCEGDPIETVTLERDFIDGVELGLQQTLEAIEKNLNALGYTMQDEPKEVKVHVNRLKELADKYDENF